LNLRTGEEFDRLVLSDDNWFLSNDQGVLAKEGGNCYLITQKSNKIKKKKLITSYPLEDPPFAMLDSDIFIGQDSDTQYVLIRKKGKKVIIEKIPLPPGFSFDTNFHHIYLRKEKKFVAMVVFEGKFYIMTYNYDSKSKQLRLSSRKRFTFHDEKNRIENGLFFDYDTLFLTTKYDELVWSNSKEEKLFTTDFSVGRTELISKSPLIIHFPLTSGKDRRSLDDKSWKIYHWTGEDLKLVDTLIFPKTDEITGGFANVTNSQIRCYAKYLPEIIPFALRQEVVSFCIEDW
jgi:hypothetical protein